MHYETAGSEVRSISATGSIPSPQPAHYQTTAPRQESAQGSSLPDFARATSHWPPPSMLLILSLRVSSGCPELHTPEVQPTRGGDLLAILSDPPFLRHQPEQQIDVVSLPEEDSGVARIETG